jgi:hypothetical protein
MIAKCQRSLSTNEPDGPQLLIYNHARDLMWMGAIPDEWNDLFGPTIAPWDNRFFAEVRWADLVRPPLFVRKLPEQDWK